MSVPNEFEIRRAKLDALIEQGIAPFPSSSKRTATCAEAIAHFDAWKEKEKSVTLAGRLMTTRVHGAIIFADLEDASGRLQIIVKRDTIGDELFDRFLNQIDPADLVQATGVLITTKRGERSLDVSTWTLLAKALRPLPEKWHGLADQETRYRQRELDVLTNPEVRRVFQMRSAIIRELRRSLEDEGFMEVETPMLQSIAGGASAKPFITHHNALDIDLYLRIAPELYLKRLVVGGMEKVFEIGRQFRNEGIDWSHNPEFTSLEFYWAYQDYHGLMAFTEKLLSRVIASVNNGSMRVKIGEDEIDFTPPWPRTTFRQIVKEACGVDIGETNRAGLLAALKKLNISHDPKAGLGKLYDELYKDTVRTRQIAPAFITDYPIEMEPLAKRCEDDPRFVQRFQLLAGGVELLKAYSELNDPIDQLARFEEQQELREGGDEEAQTIDRLFIASLEHGLPPTAGWGMGIDRFVALLANVHSVKETILFPTLRPQGENLESSI